VVSVIPRNYTASFLLLRILKLTATYKLQSICLNKHQDTKNLREGTKLDKWSASLLGCLISAFYWNGCFGVGPFFWKTRIIENSFASVWNEMTFCAFWSKWSSWNKRNSGCNHPPARTLPPKWRVYRFPRNWKITYTNTSSVRRI